MIFTFLFRDWCSDSCVLANGQSSCEGGQAPHGSDRRFLRDECQFSSSHGVRVTWTSTCLFPFLGVWVIGGVESLSTGSPSGRGSGYLGSMYSHFLHESRRYVCRFCTSHLSRVKKELLSRLQSNRETKQRQKKQANNNQQPQPPKEHQTKETTCCATLVVLQR